MELTFLWWTFQARELRLLLENRKKFHNIVLQVVCDVDKIFWNICVGQPRRVHDGGQVVQKVL
jgi:hypothetical protein